MALTTLLDQLAATTQYSAARTPINETMASDIPTIETPAYRRSLPRWTFCRDFLIGTEAIQEQPAYLPQFQHESDTMYLARRTISALFNGFARTVQATVGLLTEQPPVLSKDMPQPLVDMWENVDGAGTHGDVFTGDLAQAGAVDGYAGIITEYPRAGDPSIDWSKASLAARMALANGTKMDSSDEAALGLHPYFILCRADEVRCTYETVAGKRTLVMLIRREAAVERVGRFGQKGVLRHRVYQMANRVVTYELWTQVDGGAITRTEGPTVMRNLTNIPWSPFAPGQWIGPNEYKPTFMDLAFLNATHHRIQTGILSLEELAFVPTPVRIGASPNAEGVYPPIIFGPGNTLEAPAVQGVPNPIYWLSPDTAVLEPGMQSLLNCKLEMATAGASFLAPQQQNSRETAAANRMDRGAEVATITTFAHRLKDCLESAFGFAGQYMKLDAGEVTLNAEFSGEGVSAPLLTVMVQAYQADALTLQELRHLLQTGQLPEEFRASDVLGVLTQIADKAKAAQELASAKAPQVTSQVNMPKRGAMSITRGADGKASGIEEAV